MRLPRTLWELAPESARLCLDAEKILAQALGRLEGQHFLLSLSGGSDSTCLAVVMGILANRHKFSLSAVHFNHQLRREAAGDAAFVSGLCEGLEIESAIVRFDMGKFANSRKCGLEEAGHVARQNFCLNYARERGIDCVFLAHHADDLTEDILMRLIRGAGWPGLGGMRQRSGVFFRPFLYFPKSVLTDFLKREEICWREDATNTMPDFRRNRVRHFMAPLLLKENPGFAQSVININMLAELDRKYWDDLLAIFLEKTVIEESEEYLCLRLEKARLLKEAQAMRLRIYGAALQKLLEGGGKPGQARAQTLLALDKALSQGRGGKIFQLPGDMKIEITKKDLIFSSRKYPGHKMKIAGKA